MKVTSYRIRCVQICCIDSLGNQSGRLSGMITLSRVDEIIDLAITIHQQPSLTQPK